MSVMQPLQGVRVLDLSRILAGPWCSQHLADLGAEVIKIEKPQEGDDTRRWGPPWLEGGESAYYLCANRGKKSVTIDIAQPEGAALVRELLMHCDVLLENFKVGGLKKYGLDYASLCALKPGLIYCSITGFGQDGPYAQQAGYDFMIQGMGGLMSITGEPNGEGGGPVKVGVAVTDIFTGLYAANAIMAALLQRERTGQGAYIDMALLDVQVAVLANQALNYLTSGAAPERLGNAHPNIVPYQAFATQDGHLILAVGNDSQFERFCTVVERPQWAQDTRFSSNALRVKHRQELVVLIQSRLRERSTQSWLLALSEAGVPCGPINTIDQVFEEPQVKHRGTLLTMPHPQAGTVRLVGNPVRMNGQALNAPAPPPLLGQDTESVLSTLLSLNPEHIAALRAKGIL